MSGWAFVNEFVNDYPRRGIWNGVVALTNRPLTREQATWPKDGRLDITLGIDLLQGGQQDLDDKLAAGVTKLDQVTHVTYLGAVSPR